MNSYLSAFKPITNKIIVLKNDNNKKKDMSRQKQMNR